MPLPLPPSFNTPIPNDPFYFPQDDAVSSSTGPLVIGAGLAVQYDTGTLVAAGGGLANVTAQLPLYKIGVATNPTFAVETANRYHLGVVQVGDNIDLTPAGIISVAQSSTVTKGVVQLVDATSSTSANMALAARQGYLLQQQINGLLIGNDLTLAGTFNAFASIVTNATQKGVDAGFVEGQNLPVPTDDLNGYFVIITTDGTYTPPGGAFPIETQEGCWFLVLKGQWQYIKITDREPPATTTDAGIIRIATFGEAANPVYNQLAITPASLNHVALEKICYTNRGDILVAEGASDPTALPVGANGQVLTACDEAVTGLQWTNIADDIPCSTIVGCGSLVVGTAPAVPGALPVGTQNQYLRVNLCCPQALEWVTVTNNFAIPCACLTNAGGLVTAIGVGQPVPLPRGSNCQILTVDTSAGFTGGLAWRDNPAILKSQLQGCPPASLISVFNSQIITAPGPTYGPESNGLALTYCTSTPTGLWWAEASPPQSCFTAKGQLYVGTGNKTLCALPVGGNGQVVTADSSSSSGVIWATPAPTCIRYLTGSIWSNVEVMDGSERCDCNWLRGVGDPQNLALGDWQVTVQGNFTEDRSGRSYGQFWISWYDQNGQEQRGCGQNYWVDCVTMPFSYTWIGNNAYCNQGISWRWCVYPGTLHTRTEGIDANFTAIYLGGN